jgi:hypothetical protein
MTSPWKRKPLNGLKILRKSEKPSKKQSVRLRKQKLKRILRVAQRVTAK